MQCSVQAEDRPPKRRATADQGTKTPCTANNELSAVAAAPSGPPSSTWTCPSCHTARSPCCTAPGVSASMLVETAQLAPLVVSAVAVHGTVAASGTSCTVAP